MGGKLDCRRHKDKEIAMRNRILLIVAALSLYHCASAQLELPPNGNNQRSEVAQFMGLVKVTVAYSSPQVRGREIWGKLVPYGTTNFNVG